MGDLPDSIAELNRHYLAGEANPADCVELVLRRAEQSQASLHAFTAVLVRRATAQAELARRRVAAGRTRSPLDGVPVAVKDVFAYGSTTYGSVARRQHVSVRAASAVSTLLSAGSIIVGKTTPWEYSLGEPQPGRWPPRARNPWDLRRDPGGSSSGAAAAVAAGLVYASLATDSAGSTRGPAAYCGVVGIKPSWGTIPLRGASPLSPTLDHGGLIARRVVDVRAVLAAFDPSVRPTAEEGSRKSLTGLRVGVPTSLFAPFVEADVAESFQDAIHVLASLGATIHEVELPPADQIGVVTWIILLKDARRYLRRRLGVRAENVGLDLGGLLGLSAYIDSAAYARARRLQARLVTEVEAVFGQVDLLATPTTPSTAPLLSRRWKGSHAVGDPPESTFMSIFNLAHVPAISVPSSLIRGLPVGVQLAARFRADDFLLHCAAAFEAATGLAMVRPPFVADY